MKIQKSNASTPNSGSTAAGSAAAATSASGPYNGMESPPNQSIESLKSGEQK
jgi:hypothetical protein